jgi:BTB/POZ domain
LLDNEDLSDFCFACSDGERIHVNKCILAIQCPTFSAMLHAEMEESENGEADIEDIDSETMLELLRFLYCGKVKGIAKVDDRLLAAANKYGVTELIPICVSSLIGHTDTDNVLQILTLADLLDEKHLKENCIDLIKW